MTASTTVRWLLVWVGVALPFAGCGGDDSRPGTVGPATGATGAVGFTGGNGGTGGSDASADAGAGGDSAVQDAPIDVAAHCTNNSQDGDETDVDCGGSCPGCAQDKKCNEASDCAEKVCDAQLKTCRAATCVDLVKNGKETDKDCGGPNCSPCDDNLGCAGPSDCKSLVCNGNVCQVPSCGDQIKNGIETDVDCGGTCPADCTLGQGCVGNFDCTSNNCVAQQCQCPVGMVIAPATGGGAYCIDRFEVSYADYTKFWQGNPTVQIPECQWNLSYTPPQNWPAPLKQEDWPVRNVDWCDAYAYCKWAGKRLCGKVGGGSVPTSDYDKHTASQWHNGCSAGANLYPYGQNYNKDLCIGAEYVGNISGYGSILPTLYPMFPGNRIETVTDPATPKQACQGAAPGLFDMSGNAAEWEDSCSGTTGASDSCRIRGGSFKSGQADLTCAANRSAARNATFDDVGFRCCSP
ncbi:MAG: SUMF1/EgtB/PvdO family nonheme iron enzyme [Polyangiaceae bacterium]